MKRRAAPLVLCFALALAGAGAGAAGSDEPAQRVVHLLEYIGVDYAGAVHGGKVASADEYKEMQEFSAQVGERIASLPAHPRRGDLVVAAAKLSRMIASKAPEAAVAADAASLRALLIEAYGLQVAPRKAPDLAAGARLYTQHCAGCHGAQGRGDGPAAKALDPQPSNFHDARRMASRGVYGLYNTVTLGVNGTAMSAFGQLPEDERWALAFHVANLGVPQERVKQGEKLWNEPEARALFRDYTNVTMLSSADVGSRYGANMALVQDYLRANPEAIAVAKPDPIVFTRERLAQMLAAYDRGDRTGARELAISAYLDGFELAEASLDNVDRDLRMEIERGMIALRAAVAGGAPPGELRRETARVDALLARAAEGLAQGALSQGAVFASSFIILLREGMEAILILAAMIAFVARTGRRGAMAWLHAGWIAALAAGALTWAAATYLIEISGAGREMTEGVTALFAAATLLYVGYWLHGRTQSSNWSRFLRERVDSALGTKTLWAMAAVSFLAVYREIFEVVLFYQALWAQAGDSGATALLGGIGTAALLLTMIGWVIFKYSVRLPLAPFFNTMLWLVLLIAFVFAGQGVAKLQEAGAISINPVDFFALPLLGIHPTLETLGTQLAVVAVVAFCYWLLRQRDRGH